LLIFFPSPLSIVFLLLSSISICWYYLISRPIPLFLSSSSRLLLIIAHPDDETMFFSPLIRNALRCGSRVFVLCLSSGDFYGEGDRRRLELFDAVDRLGIDPSDVTVIDGDNMKDGSEWSSSSLLPIIIRYVVSLDVSLVTSFDDVGVSGHSNHTACSLALKAARSILPDQVELIRLESPSLFRKYSGALSLMVSLLRDSPNCTLISSPADIISSWRAMAAHRSQLLWFRYLYMITSSLLFTNTFTRVPRKVRSHF
ncbi:hypothetical protein PFISCL1PPCAC_19741, partial [Pristionchus fissidentatus]